MAMDTAQKRMSAMRVGCPWRGPLVAAAEVGFTQGNRQAADFLYSGILAAGGGGGGGSTTREWIAIDLPEAGATDPPITLGDIGG